MPPDDSYLHGTDPVEQRRLSLLNEMLNRASLDRAALRGGERILDLGCGLGQFSRLMARAAGPSGKVIGIERSEEQIAEALRLAALDHEEGLVEIRHGNAADPPLAETEWATFDVVHARFLLEHLADPAAAVRAMARAVRPGGRLLLQDDDHDLLRFFPEPPGAETLWRAYITAFERNGNDPHIGRRLPALMHAAGLRPVRTDWIFFGGCAGQPQFPMMVENMIGLCAGMREAILATGLMSQAAFEAALASLRTWASQPDASMGYALSWAEGLRTDNS